MTNAVTCFLVGIGVGCGPVEERGEQGHDLGAHGRMRLRNGDQRISTARTTRKGRVRL